MLRRLRELNHYVTQDIGRISNGTSPDDLVRLYKSGLYHQLALAPITGAAWVDSFQNTPDKMWLWLVTVFATALYLRYDTRRRTAKEKIECPTLELIIQNQ